MSRYFSKSMANRRRSLVLCHGVKRIRSPRSPDQHTFPMIPWGNDRDPILVAADPRLATHQLSVLIHGGSHLPHPQHRLAEIEMQ